MVVGVGEGARGALGHRGDRPPVMGREPCPAESAHWWGGHAAYYGQVGPRLVGMVRLPSGFPPGTIPLFLNLCNGHLRGLQSPEIQSRPSKIFDRKALAF